MIFRVEKYDLSSGRPEDKTPKKSKTVFRFLGIPIWTRYEYGP